MALPKRKLMWLKKSRKKVASLAKVTDNSMSDASILTEEMNDIIKKVREMEQEKKG